MHVLTEQFRLSQWVEIVPRYNIAPTQDVAVVRAIADDPDRRELLMMRWGLVPFWAQDPSIGPRLINARAETVAEKPAFRRALQKRRCLVVADGYYEWQRVGRAKQPYWVRRIDDRPFAMAGLWESWSGTGEVKLDVPLQSCSIITTDANTLTVAVHDRMPAILDDGVIDDWLHGAEIEPATWQNWLHPCDSSLLRVDPVSSYVNNARHEGPACVEPVALES
jgi:putative SOS response-associated peptidase YedK